LSDRCFGVTLLTSAFPASRPTTSDAPARSCAGLTNKTDKQDAKGLAILLRTGTLPEVWIPPSEIRNQRELLRFLVC
jgi:hypothetical protein